MAPPVSGAYDLLDNMYCADNGRYYETPVDWYGLARQFGYASWHQSALYFKRNVLAGCFIPHKLLSRRILILRAGLVRIRERLSGDEEKPAWRFSRLS